MDYPNAQSATNFDSDLGCRKLVGRLDAMTALSAARSGSGRLCRCLSSCWPTTPKVQSAMAHLPNVRGNLSLSARQRRIDWPIEIWRAAERPGDT